GSGRDPSPPFLPQHPDAAPRAAGFLLPPLHRRPKFRSPQRRPNGARGRGEERVAPRLWEGVPPMRIFAALLFAAALTLPLPPRATAQVKAATSLVLDGDNVTILRDSYGVPHVFAATERGVYFGNGYAV